ncbi:MAG: hypothetical protein ACKOBP_10600, partial [Planctomycetia bacterium]
IAGAASAEGASRSVFRLAGTHGWRLVTTPYAVEETTRNLAAFPASADVLLTLDRADFSRLLGDRFYGLSIMTPGMWLLREREAGRLGRV